MVIFKGILAAAGPRLRGWSRTAAVKAVLTTGMAASAIRVLADDDDKPQPLDPAASHIQLMTWASIGVILVVVVAFYGIRYFQLSRMNTGRPPDEHD